MNLGPVLCLVSLAIAREQWQNGRAQEESSMELHLHSPNLSKSLDCGQVGQVCKFLP